MSKAITIDGVSYLVSSDDEYLQHMGSDFEPCMVALLKALVCKQDVVADIGANIGLTALLFSSLATKTYAFEPSPTTFDILTQNLTKNRIKNVDPVNLGLGNEATTASITFSEKNRSGGFVSEKIKPEKGHVTEKIRLQTLDEFFEPIAAKPTFLKIDVEGYETSVIEGAEEFLELYKPAVVLEMNHFCLNVLQKITIPDFLDFLRATFPYLYAVDHDNSEVADLHEADQAYMVMHEHVVRHRFPNIVGGFTPDLEQKVRGVQRLTINMKENSSSLGHLVSRVVRPSKRQAGLNSITAPRGIIEVLERTRTFDRGGIFELMVRLTNKGEEGWIGSENNPISLSYHWEMESGDCHTFDGLRTSLARQQLEPGCSVEQSVQVLAPQLEGQYSLVLSLVQEWAFWFEDRGFETTKLPIHII